MRGTSKCSSFAHLRPPSSPVKKETLTVSSIARPLLATKMAEMEKQLEGVETNGMELDDGCRLASAPEATAIQKKATLEEIDRSLKSIAG
ncbi:unnamed protein product, partial [Prorocentrum cordatum]